MRSGRLGKRAGKTGDGLPLGSDWAGNDHYLIDLYKVTLTFTMSPSLVQVR